MTDHAREAAEWLGDNLCPAYTTWKEHATPRIQKAIDAAVREAKTC